MTKRYLKSNKDINELQPKSFQYHPINLTHIDTRNINYPICLTKYKIDENKKIKYLDKYKCSNNNNNYKKFMLVPPIGITSEDLLNLYDIVSIDSLNNWIELSIETLKITTVNRVLNCWIRVNFDTLKNYNNILENIYNNLLPRTINKKIIDKINSKKGLEKETKDFIDYWVNKVDPNNFNIDLLEDYIYYIKKKYNI